MIRSARIDQVTTLWRCSKKNAEFGVSACRCGLAYGRRLVNFNF